MADEEKKDDAAEEKEDEAADEKKEDSPEEQAGGDAVKEPAATEESPKAEEAPAKEEPKAEEAPKPSADTLGDEKPTNPLILVGAGVAVILLLIVIYSAVSGGSPYDVPGASPDLSDEDEEKWEEGIKVAGRSYITFLEEKRWNEARARKGFLKERISRRSDLAVFYQDEEKRLKRNKRDENRLDFFGDNDDDLEEFKFEDEKTEEKGGHKVYRCTVKGKEMVSSGDEDWKLEDRIEKYTLRFAWINEEWRLVGKE